jgi:hypothetical protein
MATLASFTFNTTPYILNGVQIRQIWRPLYLDLGLGSLRIFAINGNMRSCIVLNKYFFWILLKKLVKDWKNMVNVALGSYRPPQAAISLYKNIQINFLYNNNDNIHTFYRN